jgi:hypothetical protein
MQQVTQTKQLKPAPSRIIKFIGQFDFIGGKIELNVRGEDFVQTICGSLLSILLLGLLGLSCFLYSQDYIYRTNPNVTNLEVLQDFSKPQKLGEMGF